MPSKKRPAPLRRQVLVLLLAVTWLCLLSIGLPTAFWLQHNLLAKRELELAVLAGRTEAAVQQLLARQRDRVVLLASRRDLRQAVQQLIDTGTEAARQQVAMVLADAMATVPGFHYGLVLDADRQLLAASDPDQLRTPLEWADWPTPPATDALATRYLATDGGRFRHRVPLPSSDRQRTSLLLEESAAELHALFETTGSAPYRLRLRYDPTGDAWLGAGRSAAPEVQFQRQVNGSDWQLQVGIARSEVLKPLYQWLAMLLASALLLTAAMLVLGRQAARRFSRPLDLLAQYAGQWRVGTPWRARLPASSSAELQQLASGLAQMALRENAGQQALTEALLATQQVEEQFRRLFENSPIACLLTDTTGAIQLINPACASLFGYGVDELRGENVDVLVPAASLRRHQAGLRKYFSAPREYLLGIANDIYGLRKDGVELQLEIGVTPIRLGGASLALATIIDLSTRKAYEQALLAMSRTDGLTGIANRRHFDQLLAEEWRRLRRSEQGAALLMIDIDHFKALNDRHGHLVGDETLRMVAKALKLQIRRPGDFLARYGGEEFVVLLPDTGRDGARVLAEQMRQAIAALPPITNGGGSVGSNLGSNGHAASPLSISVGVASCPDCNACEPAELLEQADRQLYEAKHAGRNRVMG